MRGGEASSLKLSKWNAKTINWRPDTNGAEQGCRRCQWCFTLHQCQIKDSGKKSKSESTEGQGWLKSAGRKKGEC